jgi:hypothetical protein
MKTLSGIRENLTCLVMYVLHTWKISMPMRYKFLYMEAEHVWSDIPDIERFNRSLSHRLVYMET